MLYGLHSVPLSGFILPLPFGEFQANGSVLWDVLCGSHVCTRVKEGMPRVKEGLRACSFIQHVPLSTDRVSGTTLHAERL